MKNVSQLKIKKKQKMDKNKILELMNQMLDLWEFMDEFRIESTGIRPALELYTILKKQLPIITIDIKIGSIMIIDRITNEISSSQLHVWLLIEEYPFDLNKMYYLRKYKNKNKIYMYTEGASGYWGAAFYTFEEFRDFVNASFKNPPKLSAAQSILIT